MNISGKIKVFRNEFNGRVSYSTSIGNKNQNGEWDNMFVSVQLPKDTNIDNGTDIEVIKGFVSFYKNKNGLAQIKFVVQEMEIENNNNNFNNAETPDYIPYEITSNDDLPF